MLRIKKRLSFAMAAGILSLAGCEVEIPNPLSKDNDKNGVLVTYKIPSGEHYCTESTYKALKVSQIKFKARFNSSAIYETRDKSNQEDINKLYGMSDCGSSHQVNSARFGWRWFNNALEIWAYTYANSVRKYTFISTVPLDSTNTYEITFTGNSYSFKVNDTAVSLPRHCTAEASGYKLYPYFGGDEPAPHEITIDIEDISSN